MNYGEKTQLVNFGMVSHLSQDKQHTLLKQGKLVCPEHECDGMAVVMLMVTPVKKNTEPKEFGKPKTNWWLLDNPKLTFKTVKELANHYKLP